MSTVRDLQLNGAEQADETVSFPGVAAAAPAYPGVTGSLAGETTRPGFDPTRVIEDALSRNVQRFKAADEEARANYEAARSHHIVAHVDLQAQQVLDTLLELFDHVDGRAATGTLAHKGACRLNRALHSVLAEVLRGELR